MTEANRRCEVGGDRPSVVVGGGRKTHLMFCLFIVFLTVLPSLGLLNSHACLNFAIVTQWSLIVPVPVWGSCESSPHWRKMHESFSLRLFIYKPSAETSASHHPSVPFLDSAGWSHVPENSSIFWWMQHSWHLPYQSAYAELSQWTPFWLQDCASPIFRNPCSAQQWSCESDGVEVWVLVTTK